jgi:metal-responsive CopG/Arc/MetJ family transcriptional regulator
MYKVNVSLPEGLVAEIDGAAADLGLSRSGFIAEASARYVTDVRDLTKDQQRRADIERAIAGFKKVRDDMPVDYEFDYVAQIRADRGRDTPGRWSR